VNALGELAVDGVVVATVEVAASRAARRRGLLGRDSIIGALMISQCRMVHTIGMRFAIDVAHVDATGTVLRTTAMHPRRLGRPVPAASAVLEAELGAFERWGLRRGSQVTVREDVAGVGRSRGC
jgi:hypothetical protein